MEGCCADENMYNTCDSPSEPSPLHAKRIIDSHRNDSRHRVMVTGAEMSNIFRAYLGRLKMSYWKPEVNARVCSDAMELLDQIVICRQCEPSTIISYIALVREVYSHASINIKQKLFENEEERKREMLKQWQQIERHFTKIKYAMFECWPNGNESDLVSVYLSIAILYSFYKDVCDESVIRQCYEAAQRARSCGPWNLTECEFLEVQQYCESIESIFFLRNQHSTPNGRSFFAENSKLEQRDGDRVKNGQQKSELNDSNLVCSNRIKDGPAILAEYGKITSPNAERNREIEDNRKKRFQTRSSQSNISPPLELQIKSACENLKSVETKSGKRHEELQVSKNIVQNGKSTGVISSQLHDTNISSSLISKIKSMNEENPQINQQFISKSPLSDLKESPTADMIFTSNTIATNNTVITTTNTTTITTVNSATEVNKINSDRTKPLNCSNQQPFVQVKESKKNDNISIMRNITSENDTFKALHTTNDKNSSNNTDDGLKRYNEFLALKADLTKNEQLQPHAEKRSNMITIERYAEIDLNQAMQLADNGIASQRKIQNENYGLQSESKLEERSDLETKPVNSSEYASRLQSSVPRNDNPASCPIISKNLTNLGSSTRTAPTRPIFSPSTKLRSNFKSYENSRRNNGFVVEQIADAPLQKLHYTSDLLCTQYLPTLVKDVITVLDRFESTRAAMKTNEIEEKVNQPNITEASNSASKAQSKGYRYNATKFEYRNISTTTSMPKIITSSNYLDNQDKNAREQASSVDISQTLNSVKKASKPLPEFQLSVKNPTGYKPFITALEISSCSAQQETVVIDDESAVKNRFNFSKNNDFFEIKTENPEIAKKLSERDVSNHLSQSVLNEPPPFKLHQSNELVYQPLVKPRPKIFFAIKEKNTKPAVAAVKNNLSINDHKFLNILPSSSMQTPPASANSEYEIGSRESIAKSLSSTSTTIDDLQAAPFDPKLEFDRRLGMKKRAYDRNLINIPVIVKEVPLISGRCARTLGQPPRIVRMKGTAKPLNFDITRGSDD